MDKESRDTDVESGLRGVWLVGYDKWWIDGYADALRVPSGALSSTGKLGVM